MTNSQALKDQLGKHTEQLEKYLTPHYSSLEPWQRGILLIALTTFLLFAIYYLTKNNKPLPRELTDQEKKDLERRAEELILKRTEFLKRLRE